MSPNSFCAALICSFKKYSFWDFSICFLTLPLILCSTSISSIWASSNPERASPLSEGFSFSKIICLSLTDRWMLEAMTSTAFDKFAIDWTWLIISWETFLETETNSVNWFLIVARRSCSYLESSTSSSIFSISAKYPLSVVILLSFALWSPSTRIFTVPSGNFIIWRRVDIVPISGKSFNWGDSFPGDFWATRKIFLFVLNASSKEKIDFSLPTNKVETVFGKITTSLNGIIGIFNFNFKSSAAI